MAPPATPDGSTSSSNIVGAAQCSSTITVNSPAPGSANNAASVRQAMATVAAASKVNAESVAASWKLPMTTTLAATR